MAMLKGILALGVSSLGARKLRCVDEKVDVTKNAICILHPDGESNTQGVVSFSQSTFTSPTKIVANVRGLKPNSQHGFHIHEFGDLTEGCKTAGPHFNPHGKVHGGPADSDRHVGDLGNLKSDENGSAYQAFTDPLVSLYGENSILGRSVVVHQNPDDLGKGGFEDSLTTGHAGARIACGVIGLSASFKNLPPAPK